MNNRALTLSVIMGVLAVVFIDSYVSSIEEEARKKFGTETLVLTARRDIREMESINETMLEYKLVPKKFLEPAAIAPDKAVEDEKSRDLLKNLTGSIALVSLKQGEQVGWNKLTDPSLKTGLAPQIAPGRRAVSVNVNDVTGVSKLVKPGDRVDLIVVLNNGSSKVNSLVKTLLQDVLVLSTGKYITNNLARSVDVDPTGNGKERIRSLAEDTTYTTVALEVEPPQAQIVALIASNPDNAMVLSLRNNDDTERAGVPAMNIGDVLGAESAKFGVKGAGAK